MCACVRSNASLKPLGQVMPYLTNMEQASEDYVNSLGHLSFLISVSPQWARAFSRDFTKHLAPQGEAFTMALRFEKLKAPLFPGPRGAGGTNDWCIVIFFCNSETRFNIQTYFLTRGPLVL